MIIILTEFHHLIFRGMILGKKSTFREMTAKCIPRNVFRKTGTFRGLSHYKNTFREMFFGEIAYSRIHYKRQKHAYGKRMKIIKPNGS